MHLPRNATIMAGGALNAGCSVLGGLIILYGGRMDGTYDQFTGTVVQDAQNTFRVKSENGQTSPSFTDMSGLKNGQHLSVSFLKPTYYIVPPSTTSGTTARRLAFAVAGMGGAMLILSVFQKDQRKSGNILRGIGLGYIVMGLINSLVIITDGLQYIPVTGTAEDAGNKKFRVRFPEGYVSQDMDVPANAAPRFGSPFTVYRADQKMVHLNGNLPWIFFLVLVSCITIVIGVFGLLTTVSIVGRPAATVHPQVFHIQPVQPMTDQPDTPIQVNGRQPPRLVLGVEESEVVGLPHAVMGTPVPFAR